jgi:WD40 repeat protein
MMKQSEHTYDLFISYADADRAWVEGYLLDALTQAGVRCHSEAAFALGVPRLLQFEHAVQQSQRVFLVLSPAYLAEGFSRFTDLLAQSYGLETATWPVIPLILQPVRLPPRLAMLTPLDATDPAEWPAVVERLCAELQRPVPGPPPRPPCPYPGMVPFSEADSDRFFGRDREVQELLERLRLHPFLTVIGPSGSGKSSLVFAGLIPALRQSGLFGPGRWLARTVRPGDVPAVSLAIALEADPSDPARAALALLSTQPGVSQRLLLVVDQFEQCFTHARRYVDVEPFQQALLRIAETPDCYVVLIVRADFYPDLMAAPLWREIQAHRLEILPLDEVGLRQAIVRPAEDAGVFVEIALVERLVADAGGEPGVLPLLQETLVLLWERLERRFLPLSAYEALSGAGRTGIQVAMARRADAALADLSPELQAIVRRTFLRLIQFGEGRADTRRQQPVATLRVATDEPEAFDHTLEHLTHNRLLTLSGEEGGDGRRVDIAHEALIAGWPTLRQWLTERRGAEQTRRRLEAKAAEWVRLGRGTGGLLDEVELLEAERWLESADAADLGADEALPALVEASRGAIEEKAAQKRHAARFRLGALGAIAALVIVALVIGFLSARRNAANLEAIAEGERQLAQQQREAAATAQAFAVEQQNLAGAQATARADAEEERDRADLQAQIALARQLAAQAQIVPGNTGTGLVRSVLLAVESLRRLPGFEGGQALRLGLALLPRPVSSMKHNDSIEAVVFSPNGRWITSASRDGTVRVWETNTGQEVAQMKHEGGVWVLAASPDGQRVASGGWEGTVRVWETATGVEVAQMRHEDQVNAVAFSPDGRLVASGSGDNTAGVWEATTGKEIARMTHEGSVYAVAFSPDGRWVASGGMDNTVRVWETGTGRQVAQMEHEDWVFAVAFSPDGRWVASGSWDNTARVWEVATGQEVARMEHGYRVSTLDFSPDGQWIVSGSWDNTTRVWEAATGEEVARMVHKGIVRAVVFSPDGRWVASASSDGTVRVWEAATGKEMTRIVHRAPVNAVAFSPDGQWVVTAEECPGSEPCSAAARVWETVAGEEAARMEHEGGVATLAFSPDGRWVASGSSDHTARVWEVATGQEVARMEHLYGVSAVAFSPDGRYVASGSGMVRVWEAVTGQQVASMAHEYRVSVLGFSPDGQWVVSGSYDDTARVWEATTGEEIARMVHEGSVWAVDFSPDGQWVVSGGMENTLRVWEAATGEEVTRIVHEGWVEAIDFSPDGRLVAFGIQMERGGGTTEVWEASTGEEVLRMEHESLVRTVAFSPNGQWVASGGGDNTLWVWEAVSGREVARMVHEGAVYALAFSPDGQWVVTASGDNTVRVWEAATGREVARMAHDDAVIAVAFSPDGRRVASGSSDSTARVWLWSPDDLIAEACARLPRNLTPEEWRFYLGDEPYRSTCPDLPPDEGASLGAQNPTPQSSDKETVP